jgi:hypothetical protein
LHFIATTIRQQDQAVRLPNNTWHHHQPHPLALGKLTIRTAGTGRKPVTLTRQPAIWHRSRETVSLTMLTTYHHSPHSNIFYGLACPHHLFLKIWFNWGGPKSA